jgi:hypothetical protein
MLLKCASSTSLASRLWLCWLMKHMYQPYIFMKILVKKCTFLHASISKQATNRDKHLDNGEGKCDAKQSVMPNFRFSHGNSLRAFRSCLACMPKSVKPNRANMFCWGNSLCAFRRYLACIQKLPWGKHACRTVPRQASQLASYQYHGFAVLDSCNIGVSHLLLLLKMHMTGFCTCY